MGEEVPASFYVAIAEVLAYVYQIDARRKRPAWATG
jgi:flagellar biosynthesis protein FlhB